MHLAESVLENETDEILWELKLKTNHLIQVKTRHGDN